MAPCELCLLDRGHQAPADHGLTGGAEVYDFLPHVRQQDEV